MLPSFRFFSFLLIGLWMIDFIQLFLCDVVNIAYSYRAAQQVWTRVGYCKTRFRFIVITPTLPKKRRIIIYLFKKKIHSFVSSPSSDDVNVANVNRLFTWLPTNLLLSELKCIIYLSSIFSTRKPLITNLGFRLLLIPIGIGGAD